MYLLTIFYLSIFITYTFSSIIGNCNTTAEPPSWLKTAGHGVDDWGTAGINLGGDNFCLTGNKSAEIVEIAYHLNISTTKINNFEEEIFTLDSGNLTNACLNQDPRIHYCVPFCVNDTLQLALIEAALQSNGHTKFAAVLAHGIFNDPQNWAFTVLNINLNANPEAHLVIQSFFDPSWCSVYIGMKTTGPPYLYEMPKINEVFSPFYPFWNKNDIPHDGVFGSYIGYDMFLEHGPKNTFIEIVQECTRNLDDDVSLDNFAILTIELKHSVNTRPLLLQFTDLYGAEFKDGFLIVDENAAILQKGIKRSHFLRKDGDKRSKFTGDFGMLLIKKGNASTTTFFNGVDKKKLYLDEYTDFLVENTVDAFIVAENDFYPENQPKWITTIFSKLSTKAYPFSHFYQQSYNKCGNEWYRNKPSPGKMNVCPEAPQKMNVCPEAPQNSDSKDS